MSESAQILTLGELEHIRQAESLIYPSRVAHFHRQFGKMWNCLLCAIRLNTKSEWNFYITPHVKYQPGIYFRVTVRGKRREVTTS